MVQTQELKNKDGELLKTKQGETLKEHKLESGDVFIPQINKVLEYSKTTQNGDVIVNYKLPCLVQGIAESEPLFISLTPAQSKSINKKISNGTQINQNLFQAYTYEKEVQGKIKKYIGVGFKPKIAKPLTFNELEKSQSEEDYIPSSFDE